MRKTVLDLGSTSLLLFTSPLFGDSHKGKILYGWETSSGIQLREFGDKDIHPQYKGDVENRKPNGLGIMNFPDGRKFVGEWKNGEHHGKGILSFYNGNNLEGEWRDGEFIGHVTYVFPDGEYIGGWKDGEPHGIPVNSQKISGFLNFR